uniref:Uncharacterized protein n=1 Tax=Anguilla anguilla TaxID=7936 RepID=A0A0E9SX97_ANGAN
MTTNRSSEYILQSYNNTENEEVMLIVANRFKDTVAGKAGKPAINYQI